MADSSSSVPPSVLVIVLRWNPVAILWSGIERNGDAWESYVSDPAKVPEAELVTLIYYPVRPD